MLDRNSLSRFDFIPELRAASNYNQGTSPAELDAAVNSALSHWRPVFHLVLIITPVMIKNWDLGIFFKQIY